MRREEGKYRSRIVRVALALILVLGWVSPVAHAVVLGETPSETGAVRVFSSPETVPGRIGGDALWKTYQAIAYFWEHDWFGWSGKGAPARVVVNAQHPQWYKDNAQFFLEDQDFTPAGSVAIYPKALRARSVAASLDVVAHEWGHGVIYSSAGWDYEPGLARELHEGWADVVGYTIEWASEPPGDDAEQADWTYDEDSGPATRRVDVDDGEGMFSFHADDPPYSDPEWGIFPGNRLPVALRLSAVGGFNPVCDRLPYLNGCEIDVTPIGAEAAGYILFRSLTWYSNDTHEWSDFADLAKEAAYDLFATSSPCYNADLEQESIMQAFAAIGYPSSYPWLICRCGPNC